MSKNTKIEWAHHTFNPWVGCTKVSPACDHCYAEGWAKRSGMVKWGVHAERRRTSESNWKQPLKWNREAEIKFKAWEQFQDDNGLSDDDMIEKHGFIKPIRPRVFCASLADVFDNAVPTEWRDDLFTLIKQTPHLDWLILTKRIGNVGNMLPAPLDLDLLYPNTWTGKTICNVWIGATICNQEEADRDIPKLLSIPTAKRFLSIEPLLGHIDLSRWLTANELHQIDGDPKIDWVIVGGESGHGARTMHPQWVRSLRDQCAAANVSFFFKQWGEWVPRSSCYHTFEDGKSCAEIDPSAAKWPCIRLNENGGNGHCLENEDGGDSAYMQRVGKKTAGRLLDGRLWNEVPK